MLPPMTPEKEAYQAYFMKHNTDEVPNIYWESEKKETKVYFAFWGKKVNERGKIVPAYENTMMHTRSNGTLRSK